MPANTPAVEPAPSSWLAWFAGFGHDLRFSLRSLAKASTLSAAVVVTLALCIGANTAIFSTLYSFLLQPLPFRSAGQLVEVYSSYPKTGVRKVGISPAQVLDYKAHADLFERFSLQGLWIFAIGEETGALRMRGQRVTADFFDVFGVAPLRGRLFTADDSLPGHGGVMVLTQSFWENYFHGDPTVVGKEIRISGELMTVVGVAPRTIEAIDGKTVAFAPLPLPPQVNPQARYSGGYEMYARLKPTVGLAAAAAQLNALERQFQESVAAAPVRAFVERTGQKMQLGFLRDEQSSDLKSALLILQAGVLLVLLIGCVNVANLMLARFNTRRGEFAIRQALGATRAALLRQLLTESLVLALVGAAGGLVVAFGIIGLINGHFRSFDGQVITVTISPAVLAVTLVVTIGAAVGIALYPVFQLRGHGDGKSRSLLLSSSRSATSDSRMRLVSGSLVMAQVAVAFVLLISAGLLIRSFAKVLAVNPGFKVTQFASARVMIPATYQGPEKQQALFDRLTTEIEQLPGVEAAALMGNVILESKANAPGPFILRSTLAAGADAQPLGQFWTVSPGFFAAMGIRVIEGREFDASDRNARRLPVLVDRVLAEKYFPGQSAVGQVLGGAFMNPAMKETDWPLIVGVVERARFTASDDQRNIPYIYLPMRMAGNVTLLARSPRSADELLTELRARLNRIDPGIPYYMASSLQWRFENSVRDRRAVMQVLTAFAGLALLLAAVGIYGMLAYSVSQRTREIGIRGAIGASRTQILRLILREGMTKTVIGLAVGIAGALMATRFLQTMLFDVQPLDPIIYLEVILGLVAVTFFATYLPAHRAAKVDPVVALRCE